MHPDDDDFALPRASLGDLINWTQAEYEREALAVDRLTCIGQMLGETPTLLPERVIRRLSYRTLLTRLRELQAKRSEE